MLNAIKKIPAGTFLVPMVISIIFYTLWPDLFQIGGVTQGLLGGEATNFIIGLLIFAAGTGVDFSNLKDLLKHQGLLLLINVIISVIFAFAFLYLFGDEGILGISGLAFITTIISVNPAVLLSILQSYGDPKDGAIYPLANIPGLPAIQLIVYSVYHSGGLAGVDWMPIISVFLPLILGMILGNLDTNFNDLFGPAIAILLPLLGWNLGQGMDLVEAAQSGLPGLLLTAIFLILMLPMLFVDNNLLGYDGISGIGMMNVAGMTTAIPLAVATAFPHLEPYVAGATTQVLLVSIITSLLTPILAQRRYRSVYGEEALRERQNMET